MTKYTQAGRVAGARAIILFGAAASLLMRGPAVAFGPEDDRGAKSAEDMAKEVKAEFDRKFDELKGIATDALGKAEKGEPLAAGAKEKADQAIIAVNEAKARLDDLEQKMAREGGDRQDRAKSLGEQFVENERVKGWLAGGPSSGAIDMRVKATITSATTDADGSAGAGVVPTYLPGIIDLPRRRLTIRDLISPGRMDGNSLTYIKKKAVTNNAAPVAEGAAKPQSGMQLEQVTTTAKVIAHWDKASRQILDDVAQLRSMIDEDLLYGLKFVEEGQILNGDGTGQNLYGIVPQATAYSAPFTPQDDNGAIDQVRLMILQASLALYPANGIVMHDTDWARIETAKDGDGRYLIGNPQGTIQPTLWGLPVVPTQAISVDKVLVGAFKGGAQLFDRWDARVEVGYVNDDFTKNLVTILAEERLALAVKLPAAFIYGDLGYV